VGRLTLPEACRVAGLSEKVFMRRFHRLGLSREPSRSNRGWRRYEYSKEVVHAIVSTKGERVKDGLTMEQACKAVGLSRPCFLHRWREMKLPRELVVSDVGRSHYLYGRDDVMKTLTWQGKYRTKEEVSVNSFSKMIGVPNYAVLEKYIIGEDIPKIYVEEDQTRAKKKRLVMKRSEITEWLKGRA
jgi:hypothetical protein